jgi:hypothetical protein
MFLPTTENEKTLMLASVQLWPAGQDGLSLRMSLF